jgi:hypothetical protein
MNKKNLMSQENNSINHITIQDLAIELNELSDEDLQHIVGAIWGDGCCIPPSRGVGGSKTPKGTEPIIIITLTGSPGPYNPYPSQADSIFQP